MRCVSLLETVTEKICETCAAGQVRNAARFNSPAVSPGLYSNSISWVSASLRLSQLSHRLLRSQEVRATRCSGYLSQADSPYRRFYMSASRQGVKGFVAPDATKQYPVRFACCPGLNSSKMGAKASRRHTQTYEPCVRFIILTSLLYSDGDCIAWPGQVIQPHRN